jgi:hypothetical protein
VKLRMYDDSDIKIAGDKPSESIKKAAEPEPSAGDLKSMESELMSARRLGVALAHEIDEKQDDFTFGRDESENDTDMQRRILLTFAVAIGLEKFTCSPAAARTALNTFYSTLKSIDVAFYDDISNAGAFSFYYLAVRRHGDTERRVGQTFAMLCSHDGDPVYQELGEALYCRFLGSIREQIDAHGLLKK